MFKIVLKIISVVGNYGNYFRKLIENLIPSARAGHKPAVR
jgi:hypothetical protein